MSLFVQNLISIGIVLAFFGILLLPKFWKYLCNGLLLSVIGTLAILYDLGHIGYDIMFYPAMRYFIILVVAMESKNLFIEGVKERKGVLKVLTITMGAVLILLAMVPELARLGAITFNIPEVPDPVRYGLYVFAGVLLMIGAFAVWMHKNQGASH
ncbi:MAG: hypothetical protein ACMXYM_04890 [Candidatus Woesearchaeota archaeon]